MNKVNKVMALALASIGCASGLSACKIGGGGVPDGRTEIKVSIMSGGFGYEWLETLINDANQSQDTYWFTQIGDNKNTAETITTRIESGIVEADIYLTSGDFSPLIEKGLVEDLTPVYESASPDETKTIKERSNNYDRYAADYGKDGKIYAMQYMLSMSGIICDYDLFEEMGWLLTDNTTESGLSKGADEKEGTYDDGFPVTYEEFKELIQKIKRDNCVPFIRGDNVGWQQYRATIEPVWAQYEGLDNYMVPYTYSGTYHSPSDPNKVVEVTPETGYKVYTENCMEGREKAYQFLTEMYLYNDLENFYEERSISNTVAQAYFVTSHAMQNRIAMLLDGEWWENEARRAFEEDAYENGEGYAYGKRDFRFVPLPEMPGQAAESKGKHYFKGGTSGCVFVHKQEDEGKRNAIFDFLRMYASEKNCLNYTKANGCLMPFEYEIPDDVKETLSNFSRHMLDVKNDSSTVLVEYMYLLEKSPFVNTPPRWENILVGTKTYPSPTNLYNETKMSPADYMKAVCSSYNADKWKDIK